MIPRDMAERVLRKAIEEHEKTSDAFSEQDLVAIAREMGVDPVHVQRALEHERSLAWANEEARLRQQREEARPLPRRQWHALWLSSLCFSSLGAVVLSGGVRSIAEARMGGDYALAAVVLALGLVCFYPLYDLVRELRKTWRRRRFG